MIESVGKLKPCPFCGGEARFIVKGHPRECQWIGFEYKIKCENCEVEQPKLFKTKVMLLENGVIDPIVDERQKALEEWNRRENDLGVCRVAPQGYDIDLCPYQSKGCKKQCTHQGGLNG